MKKILLTLVVVVLMSGLILGSCAEPAPAPSPAPSPAPAPAPAPAPVKPITLKYATFNSESHGWSQALLRWQERVIEETNGQVNFENYFSGTLIAAPNAFREIAEGVADLGAGYIALQKSGFDLTNGVRAWVYGASDIYSVVRIDKELYAKYPEIREEYKDAKVLGGWNCAGFYWLSTKDKPVRSLEDFKGLTFKSSSWIKQLEALDCAPVAVPMPDAYISIQKGIIDGLMAPIEVMHGYKLAEVTKYHTEIGLVQGSQPELLFNWDSWNSLPSNVQQVLENNVPSFEEDLARTVIAGDDEGIKACNEQGGHEFIKLSQEDLDKFYETMDTVSAQEAAELDGKGYPGTELFKEARHLVELYSK
jgi:TRAP-type C4-dicarboxylate transport system substrate-binding protein